MKYTVPRQNADNVAASGQDRHVYDQIGWEKKKNAVLSLVITFLSQLSTKYTKDFF
jgi:hypothetical protein